jgi:uncharacterized protein
VHADIEALLALQIDDDEVQGLRERLLAIAPRISDLDRQRQVMVDALDRARLAVESEERRQRELQTKVATHKQLHERNIAQLDVVKKQKETTAAFAQVEAARRMLADEEGELQTMSRHLHELRQTVELQELALSEMDQEQTEARRAIDEERGSIERTLNEALSKREGTARRVPKAILSKYDRTRIRRKGTSIFPLRGPSCANCDTAIPLQRRSTMLRSGSIELCEGCGVLLYASE